MAGIGKPARLIKSRTEFAMLIEIALSLRIRHSLDIKKKTNRQKTQANLQKKLLQIIRKLTSSQFNRVGTKTHPN